MSTRSVLAGTLLALALLGRGAVGASREQPEPRLLAEIRLEAEQTVRFYEAAYQPGLIFVTEEGANAQSPRVTQAMLEDGVLGVWSALQRRQESPPDELLAALERSQVLVADPAEEGSFRAVYPDAPTEGGENRLRTQQEVNWFVQTFCGKAPEHCLLYNLFAWSISAPTRSWMAVAFHASSDDHFYGGIPLETYYWAKIPNNQVWHWAALVPIRIIPNGRWHSVSVPAQSKKWVFRAVAFAFNDHPELVGLRAGWMPDPQQPPPPPPEQCLWTATIKTTTCYNVDGTISNLTYTPISAVGCGGTPALAEQRATISLSQQTCISGQPWPGCCLYQLDPAFAGCVCQ